MTVAELIKTLADDLGVTRARVEDFMNAFYDLGRERLKNGENFSIGRLGILSMTEAAGKPAVRFHASQALRDALGMGPVVETGPLCVGCNKRPRAPRHRECHGCIAREYRKRKNMGKGKG